jgi:HlyD family secretion protein
VNKASLARAEEELAKTIIVSPLTGTVSKLNLEVGERVAGNTMMAGTEIMTVADLNDMEARVEIGEIDVVLLGVGQTASLEVDAFRDRKFKGTVSDIANSSRSGLSAAAGGGSQDATKFEVKIRIDEKEAFRPGMSVTAEIQTRTRTNVLCVPVQSVTTRMPKPPKDADKSAKDKSAKTNSPPKTATTNVPAAGPPTNTTTAAGTNQSGSLKDKDKSGKKSGEAPKPIEVVFLVEADRVKMVPVKRGINDDAFAEITEGLAEGQEIVSGGYKAISRELEDAKKIRREKPGAKKDEKEPDKK